MEIVYFFNIFSYSHVFLTTRSREEACAAVEGFPARPERAARQRGTERERALEAQFSDGIRDGLLRAAWWNLSAHIKIDIQ